MDCFHDFCLACDRESTNGPYCSQTCRLADLDRATSSSLNSPTSPSTSSHRWSTQSSGSPSAYVLAPAYNFQDRSPYESQPREQSRPQSSYFMRSPAQKTYDEAAALQRCLTPSSSHTSLSSNSSSTSTASGNGMSAQAKSELQNYFSSFAQAKAAKRRQSLR